MDANATPANPACVVNCAWYDAQGRRHDLSLEQLSDKLAEDAPGFAWVGLYEPSDAILALLQEELGLHALAVEDARNAHQRPKVEAYGDTLFLALHTAQMVDGHIRYGETHAFLGTRFLMTVRHGASLSYAAARSRMEREPELLRLGPAMALYAVLDFIVDNYLPIVDEHRDSLHALERDIFSDTYRRAVVVRLYDLKRDLTYMRVAVSPLQDVLAQLMRSQVAQGQLIREEVRLYLRDVHDHVLRINDAIDTLRDMLGTALSVNLSLVTLAQGETVKRLGAWAALLAAPTLITSWYGMNFQNMPELQQPWAYPAVIVGVGAICIGLYRLFKRAKWL
ncbi:magnesium and cobalt transport protein CorA [Flavobacterium sp. MXW15]|uniref:Magnesium and cobalt transport protein CorA n=1 Tax=Xanthomonas chitinilytica TaxID=2989819 RepID=A0ABT3JRL9_9XANT|nr:magnesium and cobalt transport protein CorA [Xanthomonas sp. H13-6]MCW4453809.1 magnesium and cobalt transport protein CorA [Flavobacterium sp. MXW15]MCW4471143.1 magnesium and cobalt transport protein CorA [Xanthomonas sp. H13-6]